MSIESKTQAFVGALQRAYFEERDIEKICSMAAEDVIWSGLFHHDCAPAGSGRLETILREDFKRSPHAFTVLESSVQTTALGPENCLAECQLTLRHNAPERSGHDVRLSASLACSLIGGRILLRQLHLARIYANPDGPDALLRDMDLPPDANVHKLIEDTTRELDARNRDLQQLTENIPGGIFRCLYDARLTILQVNDGFLSMFGYTRSEIREKFNDSFFAMIDPRDRAATWQEVERQMGLSNTKQIEYRVTRGDGRTIWVLDKGQLITTSDGPPSFYCILIDDTAGKEAQENLRLSLERHEIIMDQANDIIFEWDIRRDNFVFSHNWQKKFGYQPITENVSVNLTAKSHLHPADVPVFAGILNRIRNGESYVEAEVRIQKNDGLYLWCRVRITAQYDESGHPFKAVGVFVDIDNERKKSEELTQKAQRDTLTKLYNKGTAESLIESQLSFCEENTRCALMIIDIDNFKNVNDTRGHLFGDAFLMEISAKIQSLFRSSDIVGRIGGDEFIVFLRDIPATAVATAKAVQVLENFHHLDEFNFDGGDTSCSIGIACYPDNAVDFHALYKCADYALYQAKRQGKNQFVVFNQTIEDMAFKDAASGMYSAVGARIDSDTESVPHALNSQLVEYVFRILYQSIDLEAAVSSILEIVGRQFDVSRVYIFENSEDDLYCSNTFEWCNEGITPEIENLALLSYEDDLKGHYLENFDENGIFYCQDIRTLSEAEYAILAPQGVKSLLQCAINDNGHAKGYVGFDECRSNRLWTQEQVSALSFIAEILSTFLLKKRAQDRAEQSLAALTEVLDSQNAWIYVVEPASYRLLYINRKTKSIAPASEVGMTCHQAFFDQETPCEACPVRGLSAENNSSTLEVYNPVLKVWSAADASVISWKNTPAWLLSCHDITPYKKNNTP
ncbi:diguanylate cyclase [Eubacterium sp. 1001713B170207_170306_E7]|uniref:diguanylate cyclase domain-containing protein n=1 Tax=Eubacterium sp. 1001713B170207_170306_E7 TaxID=2787097 RepID=UPI0018983332|nr:diguanylate cyclase [Eubacterium sp. 1001713B170207_170306_E7]